MQASLSLRRPSNWQDFETLCLKLWSEIWSYPETKKNGRLGQVQQGVDIFGIPSWEKKHYYGIQCKGKDEYSNKQFTVAEIDTEIEKAKQFKPELKKLYFATTALKDVNIEEHVRKKNIAQIEIGSFEIHLFSWEEIVSLIDDNKHTHDWYINDQKYKTKQSVEVTFENDSRELTLSPIFSQKRTSFRRPIPESDKIHKKISAAMQAFSIANKIAASISDSRKETNLSYVGFRIRIHNTGQEPIQDYKLQVQFEGNIQHLNSSNVEDDSFPILTHRVRFSTFINSDDLTATISPMPAHSLIVGEDFFTSEDIFLKPHHEEKTIKVKWKLISRNYKAEGELNINLESKIEWTTTTVTVDSGDKERVECEEIEDFIKISE